VGEISHLGDLPLWAPTYCRGDPCVSSRAALLDRQSLSDLGDTAWPTAWPTASVEEAEGGATSLMTSVEEAEGGATSLMTSVEEAEGGATSLRQPSVTTGCGWSPSGGCDSSPSCGKRRPRTIFGTDAAPILGSLSSCGKRRPRTAAAPGAVPRTWWGLQSRVFKGIQGYQGMPRTWWGVQSLTIHGNRRSSVLIRTGMRYVIRA